LVEKVVIFENLQNHGTDWNQIFSQNAGTAHPLGADEIILNSDYCFYPVGYTNYNMLCLLIQIDFNWICREILANFFYSENLIIMPFSVLGLIYHCMLCSCPGAHEHRGQMLIYGWCIWHVF
jgi:hypothetical protein